MRDKPAIGGFLGLGTGASFGCGILEALAVMALVHPLLVLMSPDAERQTILKVALPALRVAALSLVCAPVISATTGALQGLQEYHKAGVLYICSALLSLALFVIILAPVDCDEQMEALDSEFDAQLMLNTTTLDDEWKENFICDKTETFLMHAAFATITTTWVFALACLCVMVSISKRCEYLPGGWSELLSRAVDFKNYKPNNEGTGVELFTGQNAWLCVRSILNNTIESLGVIFVMRISLTAGVAYLVSNVVSNLSYNIPNREL